MKSFFKRLFSNPFNSISRVESAMKSLVQTKAALESVSKQLTNEYDKAEKKIQKIEDKKNEQVKAISRASIAARNIAILLGE